MTQLIPCTILVLATIAILIKLAEAKKRRDAIKKGSSDSSNDQTGNALLAILILFLVCELPLGILLMLNIVNMSFYSVLLSLFHFTAMMRLLNASLNFILYCTMSSLFRTTFKEVVSNVISEVTSHTFSNGLGNSDAVNHSHSSNKPVSIEMSK